MIYIIRLPILLAIKCNLQKGDSFIASKDVLAFVPCNRKIFLCSKLCSHGKVSHLKDVCTNCYCAFRVILCAHFSLIPQRILYFNLRPDFITVLYTTISPGCNSTSSASFRRHLCRCFQRMRSQPRSNNLNS